MRAEHAEFEYDDAAYVLGGLDEPRRVAFETHLTGCPTCQARVAELAELPALMAHTDIEYLQSALDESEPAPDTLLPRLLREVTASRRRRAWRSAGLGLAAACLVALLAVGGVTGWRAAHGPDALTMQAVGPNAADVHATILLTKAGQGTRVKLDCGYHAGGAGYPSTAPPSYRMVIFNRLGQQADLGVWQPLPGEDVEIARTSPWPRAAIAKIEVSVSTGQTILRLTL